MIALATIDVILTFTLASYAHQMYSLKKQSIVVPPNQSIYINSSQNLQINFSTQNFQIYKTGSAPHLTLEYKNFTTSRTLFLQESTNFGVLQGLNQLYIKTNEDAILELVITNSKLDNVFIQRTAIFIVKKDQQIFYEFTTNAMDLFEFSIEQISLDNIQTSSTTYIYDQYSNIITYRQLKKLTKAFTPQQEIVIHLQNQFLSYESQDNIEILQNSTFNYPVILKNTNQYNNIYLVTSSPSILQKSGCKDIFAFTVSFYIITIFSMLFNKYNANYQQ
ncbi:hypothetical protein SS50377_26904 [Spironucleus salmonicida]|uniref:Transmembrane domain-containing protein n=1 Tax=Spironucleus salmonicida TaxID=348837 RepID=V6LS64_9EUKA|nr:hypothetical protein SS50377_26904 [Spironucleus salmonicida]|eukprot:EST47415.1 Transmembrane domain-containing protein [Spironucleus salmonicida]